MSNPQMKEQWPTLSAGGLCGIAEWGKQHPRASLLEIEETVDERFAQFRARVLQDTAQASQPGLTNDGKDVQPAFWRDNRMEWLGRSLLLEQGTLLKRPLPGLAWLLSPER